MKDKIEQIKTLLAEIEVESGDELEQQFSKNYNALELPSLVSAVVDYLHPLLNPYEIAVYWYLFNKSIVKTGEQYVRASTRGVSVIAKSASGKSDKVSYTSIKNTIETLKVKEVVLIVGDTNCEGTLYKVAIPDEIPHCKASMQQRASKEVSTIEIKRELDFYNAPENRLKIFERDGYKCHYCEKQLTRFSATLDHIQPVSKGGDNSFDNLITACLHCNAERGNKPAMDFIELVGRNN